MADKHHSARYVRKKQKELNKKQKMSLGMEPESERDDFEHAVFYFPGKIDIVKEETIRQNGRIDAVEISLDKRSPMRNEYRAIKEHNDRYIEQIEKFEKTNEKDE